MAKRNVSLLWNLNQFIVKAGRFDNILLSAFSEVFCEKVADSALTN